MNTILEGVYNSMFDPQVFFYGEEGFQIQKADKKKREYSIGNYINLIGSPLDIEELIKRSTHERPQDVPAHAHNHVIESEAVIAQYLSVLAHKQPLTLIDLQQDGHTTAAQRLNLNIFKPATYKRILYRFLRASSDQCLQVMKKRIERCRRALLSELIEITHRRLPLIQIEPPTDENEEHIDGVNEDQLRGYVMLLAAKLPLIQDIGLHVKEIDEHFSLFQKHEEGIFVLHSWDLLVDTIRKQIERLEATIQQASLDRQLYEEEKIRTEEENLAEIERLRTRTEESIAPIETKTVSFISNFLALSAVALTLFSFLRGTKVIFPEDLLRFETLIVSLEILATAIVLTFLYVLVQSAVVLAYRLWRRFRRQGQKVNESYYYECDIHLSSPISLESAGALLNGDFYYTNQSEVPPQDVLINVDQLKGAAEAVKAKAEEASQAAQKQDFDRTQQAVESLQRQAGGVQAAISSMSTPVTTKALNAQRQQTKREMDRFFINPVRSSYRVERINTDSAFHKIYIELAILLPSDDNIDNFKQAVSGDGPPKKQKYKKFSTRTFLVYEILFHQPAAAQSYILQNLRVIINNDRILTSDQLGALKLIIQRYFVNRWIEHKTWAADNVTLSDSLLTLTPKIL